MDELKENLILEIKKLHERNELSKTVGPSYFEPGMMEFLDKSDGFLDEITGNWLIRFEAKGTRYEGRTELIEKLHIGDSVSVVRDRDNKINSNNFKLISRRGQDIGNMPMELCNAFAPLYDNGDLSFQSALVSYFEPLSQRSRYAKQAVLFIELKGLLRRGAF